MPNGFAIHSYGPTHTKTGSFAHFDQQLQGRCKLSRKLENNTYLERRGENIAVRLHQTDIMTFQPDGTIIVNSGGWKTVTTKARLNEFLPSGFGLYAKKGAWNWTSLPTEEEPSILFTDGDKLVLDGNGNYKLEAQATPADEKRIAKLRKEINAYAEGFVKNLPVEMPSGGDCWMCAMGDKASPDHLLSHIKTRYYVPRLLWQVLEAHGAGDYYFQYAFKNPNRATTAKAFGQSFGPRIKKWIKSTVCRRLGLSA